MAAPAIAQAPQQARVAFSIPAQPMASALRAFATQSGHQMLFDEDKLSHLQAPALEGNLTPGEALTRLLAGSGMTATQTSPGLFTVREVPATLHGGTLEAVTVTAQADRNPTSEGTGSYVANAVTLGKTEQTLREIPQSVSVMTRQQIDDQQLTSLGDALAYMPGVAVAAADEESAFTRGYKAQVQLSGVARTSGAPDDYAVNDLETFDRVEVLRGPAGLLTGRGTPGGAVNYERKRPKHDFAVAASASVGSWSTLRSTLDVTGPMNTEGSLRGRFVTALQDGDSFQDGVTDKTRVLYGILEHDLTSHTTLGLSALHEKRDYVSTFIGLPSYTDGRMPGRSAFVGPDRLSSLDQTEYKFDLTHRFANEWTAKVIGYHVDQNFDHHFGIVNNRLDSATGLTGINVRHNRFGQTYKGVDANLAGPFDLFGRTHSAMVGYQWLTYKFADQRDDGTGLHQNTDVLNRHDFAATPLSDEIGYQRAREPSLYGVVRFKLRDDLTAILGGSLTSYEYQNRNDGTWVSDDAKIDDEFTPYGGLVWDVNDSTALYASYAEIFQTQYGRDFRNNVLPPRTGEQYEIGVKQGLLDDRLNLAVAVFRLQDTNRSVVDPDNVGCANGRCVKPAGMIESKGIDTEISGSPLPGWNFSAGYTYNDIRYKKGENVGQRFLPALTPKHLFKLWTHYDLGHGIGGIHLPGWSVGLGVRAQSGTYADHLRQGTYAIYTASVGYRVNRHLRATLTVDNLFDETYFRNIGTSTLQNYYGEPRKVMLTLRTEF